MDFTTNLAPPCRAFTRALKIEKLKAPLFPGPEGQGIQMTGALKWSLSAKCSGKMVDYCAEFFASLSCADPESFFRGVQLFFQVHVPLKSGLHRPASETPFKWRFAGVQMMAQH